MARLRQSGTATRANKSKKPTVNPRIDQSWPGHPKPSPSPIQNVPNGEQDSDDEFERVLGNRGQRLVDDQAYDGHEQKRSDGPNAGGRQKAGTAGSESNHGRSPPQNGLLPLRYCAWRVC